MPRDTKLILKSRRASQASQRGSADNTERTFDLGQGQCRVLEMIAVGASLGETFVSWKKPD